MRVYMNEEMTKVFSYLQKEIEFKEEPAKNSSLYNLYWRIRKDQLGVFDRTFKNPWRQVFCEFRGQKDPLFTKEEEQDIKGKLKTLYDITTYSNDVENRLAQAENSTDEKPQD